MKPRTVLAGIAAMLDAAALSWIVATFLVLAAASAFAGRVPFRPHHARRTTIITNEGGK